MVTRKRTKLVGRKAPARKPRALLKEGDWLDVMDGDGVWNVARVLSVPSPDEVEIKYDGWAEEYDEVVRVDSNRVAPYHTFTSAVKCWVKYLNWPLWPSLITIRAPGTEDGIRNLAAEKRLYVDFLDSPNFGKRDRCWQMKRLVKSFEENYDRKRTETTGDEFEEALGWVLQSDASTKMPKFAGGTLPEEYKSSLTDSVETVRKNMGDELWFQSFTHNKMRHKMSHVYETSGDEDDDASSDDAMPSTRNKKVLNLATVKVETQVITNKKKRSPPVKIELNQHAEAEVPYELEPMDSNSSDDSPSEDELGGSRSKRKRLRTNRRSDGLSKPRKGLQKQTRPSASPRESIAPNHAARLSTTKNNRTRHSKGQQVKMAARRSIPPRGGYLSLKPSTEPVASRFPAAVTRTHGVEAPLEDMRGHVDSMANEVAYEYDLHHQEHSESEVDSDHVSVSFELSEPSASIDEELANTKRKLQALEKEKQHATGGMLTKDLTSLNDPSPMSSSSQGRPQLISPSTKMESHRSKRATSELTTLPQCSNESHTPSVLPKAKRYLKGNAPATSAGHEEHVEMPNRATLSITKLPSVDDEETKTTSGGEMLIIPPGNQRLAVASALAAGKEKTPVKETRMVSQDASANENEDDDASQEQRRRFCVMQGNYDDILAKEASGLDVNEKVKCSKKTIVSVPRKFGEVKPTRVPACCTNSVQHMASPPRLRHSAPGARTGVALTPPSTAVFSSSRGFSMESWFKRKMMRDFMSGS